jgi:hypothetical protein
MASPTGIFLLTFGNASPAMIRGLAEVVERELAGVAAE